MESVLKEKARDVSRASKYSCGRQSCPIRFGFGQLIVYPFFGKMSNKKEKKVVAIFSSAACCGYRSIGGNSHVKKTQT